MNRVLVVGDDILDKYWIGEVNRVSPECPIPIVKINKIFSCPGGAGNVDRNLRTLGVETDFLTPTERMIVKNRLMVEDYNLARWDQDVTYSPIRLDAVMGVQYSAVVVADYLKGSVDKITIQQVQGLCLPMYVDTKGDPEQYLNIGNVTIFPNKKEYNQYKETYNRFEKCVLKEGKDGLSYLKYGVSIAHEPARARFVKSVSGAGDTVVAAYVVAKMKNYRSPLSYAAWAAGNVVEQSYTAVPNIALKDDYSSTWGGYSAA
jgi:bifunctional ADP-heptose synthase (sugar kinase/adenylyltransferase)